MDLSKFEKLQEERDQVQQKIAEFEREFSEWLETQKDWRLFIVGRIHDFKHLSRTYVYEHLSSQVADFCEVGESISFKIKVYNENSICNYWLDVNYFPVKFLNNLSEHTDLDQSFIHERIKMLEGMIEEDKDEIKNMENEIERKNKEIEKYKRWLK